MSGSKMFPVQSDKVVVQVQQNMDYLAWVGHKASVDKKYEMTRTYLE